MSIILGLVGPKGGVGYPAHFDGQQVNIPAPVTLFLIFDAMR